MGIKLKILSLAVGVVTLFISLINVKRRKLSEGLAFFWIILSCFMVILAIKFSWVERLSGFLGILDPNNMVFFMGLVFLVFISFYFSIKISRLEKRLITLAQENALLKKESAGGKKE